MRDFCKNINKECACLYTMHLLIVIFLADEDECDNGFAACRLYETCTNTPGSYKCSCPRGFNPNNYCQDINECVEIGCHKDAFCRNTEGSFSCSCKKGYEGDGYKECLDSDECKIVANKVLHTRCILVTIRSSSGGISINLMEHLTPVKKTERSQQCSNLQFYAQVVLSWAGLF